MRESRRRFFIGSGLGWMLFKAAPSRAAKLRSPPPADVTLKAYVDVLIPADETPSATALGVDKQLLSLARSRSDYQRLLDLGLDWLNARAHSNYGGAFTDLNDEQREAVVRQAAAATYGSLPRVFFERIRADAFRFYYSRPESWRGIAYYRGPPQPIGFLDYAERPRKQR